MRGLCIILLFQQRWAWVRCYFVRFYDFVGLSGCREVAIALEDDFDAVWTTAARLVTQLRCPDSSLSRPVGFQLGYWSEESAANALMTSDSGLTCIGSSPAAVSSASRDSLLIGNALVS